MPVLFGLLGPLSWLNATILAIGRWIAIAALAIMVVFILIQVWFRYVDGSALNWTEEAARFGMIWMTGLMAGIGCDVLAGLAVAAGGRMDQLSVLVAQ